jgi:hypothetical protein
MRANGFKLIRDTKHGTLWNDADVGGKSMICIAGTTGDWRSYKNTEAEVRRAVEARQANQQAGMAPAFKQGEKSMTLTAKIGELNREPIRKIVNVTNGIHREPPKAEISPALQLKAKHTRVKDNANERVAIWTRIAELAEAKLSNSAIAEVLNGEGITRKGDEELTGQYVASVLTQLTNPKPGLTAQAVLGKMAAKRAVLAKPAPREAITAPIAPAPAATPLPEKAPEQAPVSAAPRRRLPAFAVGILTDPELTDAEKVKMLMVYSGGAA